MTNTNDIIATGGFNTGRLYSKDGQRIFWAQRADGWLFFHDIDRCVFGWVDRGSHTPDITRPVAPNWLTHQYDIGEYDWSAPNQKERNPSVPADFDFGAALRI